LGISIGGGRAPGRARRGLLYSCASLLALLAGAPAMAVPTEIWTGATNSDFSTDGNWAGLNAPTTGNATPLTFDGTAVRKTVTFSDADFAQQADVNFLAPGYVFTIDAAGADATFRLLNGSRIVASAANAPTIILNGTAGGTASLILFAGSLENANIDGLGSASTVQLIGGGTAGDATITGVTSVSFSSGVLIGNADVSAGQISLNGQTLGSGNVFTFGSGSSGLYDTTSLGTATVTLDGGNLGFYHTSSGGSAAFSFSGNGGVIELAGLSTGGTSLGSLSGTTGTINLDVKTLTVGSLNTSTSFGGGILGDGGFTKTGSGTLILTGVNSYSGTTTINGGVLQVDAFSLGDGDLVLDGGTLRLAGSMTMASSRSVALGAGGGGFDVNSGVNFNVLGVVGDGGGGHALVKTGSGTLTLSGANTYGGGTLINGGVLAVGADTGLGANGGGVTLAGGTLQFTGSFNLSAGRAMTLGAGGGTLNTNGFNTVVSQAIGESGGTRTLTKAGGGTLTLSGINSYSGGTIVNGGILNVSADANLGASGGGLTLGFGTLQFGGSFNLSSSRAITIANGQGTIHTNGFDTVISQSIGESGSAGALSKSGAGTLTLSGNNTYSGGTFVSAGALAITGDASLGAANSAVSLGFGGTIRFENSFTLAATRAVQITIAGTFDTAGNNAVIAGTIADFIVAGTLTKTGLGTLTLTGNNSYSGGTTVAAGTLSLGTSGAAGTGAITTTGSVIDYADGITVANAIVIASDTTQLQTLTGVSATQSGAISESGGARPLEKTGTGTLILTGANSYSGTTTISAGTLQIGAGGTQGSLGTGNVVNNGTLAFNRSDTISVTGAISGSGQVTKTGAGALFFYGANSFTGPLTVSAGEVSLSGGVALADSAAVTLADGTKLTVSSSETIGSLAGSGDVAVGSSQALTVGGNNNSTTFSGAFIGGNGSLTKSGTGTLTLNGAYNASTGSNIRVQGGTLALAGGFSASPSQAFDLNGAGSTLAIEASQTLGNVQNIGAGTRITIADGQTLTTVTTGTPTLGAAISGSGNFTKAGAGTLQLTVANTYTGATTVSAGRMNIFFGAALPDVGAVTVDSGATLGIGNSEAIGSLAGAGSVTINPSQTLTIGGANTSTTFSGVIAGSGAVAKAGTGTLTLSGANSYAGATMVNGGMLALSGGSALADTNAVTVNTGAILSVQASETIGSIAGAGGISLTAGQMLTAGGSNASTTLSGVIAGAGGLVKSGTGTLTLTGTNTFTGATTVAAGTLSVNGAIASSAVTVANGALLNGTGTVGSTIIAAGGTLSPGNSIGTLTVNGNLTMASDSSTSMEISQTDNDKITVTGNASLGGTLAANFAPGTYNASRYTLLTANGGVTGSFATLSLSGHPTALRARLTYDASNVYLNLDRSELLPVLGAGTASQTRVASAIDRTVLHGVIAPDAFSPLYNLSGAALGAALDQLVGQIGVQSAQAASASFQPFLQLMLDQDGAGSLAMAQYAPGKSYADSDAPKKAQLAPGELRLWGAAFGGGADYDGNAALGLNGLQSSFWRFGAGIQREFEDGLMLGASLAAGQDSFETGNDKGRAGDITVAVQARQTVGQGYIAAALGFGATDIKTTRIVAISGTDVLQGKFDGEAFGGRIEAGYRFDLDGQYGLTPFAAFAGQDFATPAYTETAIGGSNAFALSYQGGNRMLGQTELGARIGRSFAWGDRRLNLEAMLGWAHSYNDPVAGVASFQALSGASFQVLGVTQAEDSALLGLKLEGRESNGLFYNLKLDSSLAGESTVVAGTGSLGWRW
jgi:autotransporter-associated beta strand protein